MREGKIRVFFNASALPARPAGAGIYTLELARALDRHPEVVLIAAAPEPYRLARSTTRPSFPRPARPLWEWRGLPGELRRQRPDVYHGPHFFVPKVDIPTVATVHDLTFFRIPKRYDVIHREYYRLLARTSRRADRIIVPSSAVAADVVRYLGYPPERIRVIAEAPRAGLAPASEQVVAEIRARLGLEQPYLLALGTAEPGKRVVDAIRAMPAIRASTPGTLLALAGNPGPLSAAFEHEVRRLDLGDCVKFLGYVDDADLGPLLTGAAALVFPSLFEGFGLPPLEAMACGTPVIATSAPAMSEVLAGAAMFVPLRNPAAIASAAIRLLSEPGLRSELSARAIEFAAQFSWEKAARETVDVYQEITR